MIGMSDSISLLVSRAYGLASHAFGAPTAIWKVRDAVLLNFGGTWSDRLRPCLGLLGLLPFLAGVLNLWVHVAILCLLVGHHELTSHTVAAGADVGVR